MGLGDSIGLRPIGFIILANFRVLVDDVQLVGNKGGEG